MQKMVAEHLTAL